MLNQFLGEVWTQLKHEIVLADIFFFNVVRQLLVVTLMKTTVKIIKPTSVSNNKINFQSMDLHAPYYVVFLLHENYPYAVGK